MTQIRIVVWHSFHVHMRLNMSLSGHLVHYVTFSTELPEVARTNFSLFHCHVQATCFRASDWRRRGSLLFFVHDRDTSAPHSHPTLIALRVLPVLCYLSRSTRSETSASGFCQMHRRNAAPKSRLSYMSENSQRMKTRSTACFGNVSTDCKTRC